MPLAALLSLIMLLPATCAVHAGELLAQAEVAPMSDVVPAEEAEPLNKSSRIVSDDRSEALEERPAFRSLDRPTAWLGGLLLAFLIIAFFVGRFLRRQPENFVNPAMVRMFNKRIGA